MPEKQTKNDDMTKLAIFDLDGTLLDTERDLANATNFALRSCGFPERPTEDYYKLVGNGIYNLFRKAVQPMELSLEETLRRASEVDEETVARVASYFRPYYEAHICDYTKPYDGIMECLEAITSKGVRIAVASNKYQEGAERLVGKFFGDFSFVKVLGQREGHPIKPDPEIVRQIMAAVPSVSVDETAYVGDSDVDMKTGRNAGVRTIGVSWGFRPKDELTSYEPAAIVDSPDELRAEILGE